MNNENPDAVIIKQDASEPLEAYLSREGAEVRLLVKNALQLRRNSIVYSLACRFFALMESCSDITSPALADAAEEWTKVESLSQLRTLVGGRFHNLKAKWIAAGLPLRQHRGDRKEQAKINLEAWFELASWCSSQGYQVRLAGENDNYLLELNKKT